MTPAQHKQYLIDSIAEMDSFIDKVICNIYDRRDTISESSLSAMQGIIDRKKKNIVEFRELLQAQYNHTI